MGRTGWGWCVLAGMLLGLAGCTWGDFLAVGYQQQDGKGEVRFVAGVSVDGVARSARAILERMGMTVEVQEAAPGMIRLKCTKGDTRLTVLLTRRTSSIMGAEEGVKVEMESCSNKAVGLEVMAALEVVTPK